MDVGRSFLLKSLSFASVRHHLPQLLEEVEDEDEAVRLGDPLISVRGAGGLRDDDPVAFGIEIIGDPVSSPGAPSREFMCPSAQIGIEITRRLAARPRRLDLSQETLGTYDCSQLGLQDLERDLPLVPEILRQVDRSHPALADLTLDAVAALQGSVSGG